MAGEVISESILIIASIVLVGILASAVFYAVTFMSTGFDSAAVNMAQRLTTSLTIVYATNTSSNTVVFYIQNVGQTPVYMSSSTVYFGKVYELQQLGYNSVPGWSTTTTVLYPGSTAQVTITLSCTLQQNQYYEIMFVAPNGYETTYVFEVT